jgi:hypothetical protein
MQKGASRIGGCTNADKPMRPNADRSMRPNADTVFKRPNDDNLKLRFFVSKRTDTDNLYCPYALTTTTDSVHMH